MITKYVYQSAQVGEFRPALLYGAGPSSYSQSGDPVTNPGANEYIATPFVGVSLSGNYDVFFTPLAIPNIRAGAPSPSKSGWVAHWWYANPGNSQGVDGVVIATAGSGQTNGTYTISGTGGGGSGATIQVVVSGNAVTGVKVLNPGTGYTSAPTFTVAAGGTPGTVTATIGTYSGMEVAAGTNLSAEVVQFGAFVTQL